MKKHGTIEHYVVNIAMLFHARVKAVFREFVLYIAAENFRLILHFLCHKHLFLSHITTSLQSHAS